MKLTNKKQMQIMSYGLSCGFIVIDIALLYFFQYYGVRPLAAYSIASVVFYLLSLLIIKYEEYWLYTVSIYAEVTLHMTLCVICLGTGKGFEISLIGMNLVAFYAEYLSNKYHLRHVSGTALGSIGMIIFLELYIYSHYYPAPYELPESVSFWLQIAWGFIIFAINIIFLKIFVNIALHSERVLTDAQTMANSMVTALSADYTSVYYVNLDEDKGMCYQEDKKDLAKPRADLEFPFYENFREYGMNSVAESYRDGFLSFIDPENIREALSEKPIISYRYLVRRNDQEFYEMIRMAGVRHIEDRYDNTVHSVGVGFTNIDDEMRETMARNEAMAEALSLAEEASKAKTSFLSSMSHEIRTPMNAIIGLDTLALNDENISPQTREYLEKIGASAKHLLSLINDILDMSRIESGRMVLRREEFSFSDMFDQINTMVSSQCADKGIKYQNRVLSDLDDYYIGDDMKLKEILINILSNAIKFTNAPGKVTLSVERTATFEDQSTLQFRIKDTGIGMDTEFIPKIFDAFSQEDGSRKNKYGSTGLGMAITKNLVEMMNGTIVVQSEKGVGTEFIVSVTLKNAVHEATDQDKSLANDRIHVLIADVDEIAAEHARMTLKEAGIRADVCTGSEKISGMLELQDKRNDPYNLVLLDRNLSESNGLKEASAIRGKYDRKSTAIIMTAYSWDDIHEEAVSAGADSLLTKPLFSANILREFERIARRNKIDIFREKEQADLSGRRILLAEDVEINAEIMLAILEMNDMEADHAENGQIAVEMFDKSAAGKYAAILMDVRMPVMDGLEAASAIRALSREDAKKIPIIALTANAFDEDVQRSLQAGMNAHLTKPVEPEHLVQTLGELIYESEH